MARSGRHRRHPRWHRQWHRRARPGGRDLDGAPARPVGGLRRPRRLGAGAGSGDRHGLGGRTTRPKDCVPNTGGRTAPGCGSAAASRATTAESGISGRSPTAPLRAFGAQGELHSLAIDATRGQVWAGGWDGNQTTFTGPRSGYRRGRQLVPARLQQRRLAEPGLARRRGSGEPGAGRLGQPLGGRQPRRQRLRAAGKPASSSSTGGSGTPTPPTTRAGGPRGRGPGTAWGSDVGGHAGSGREPVQPLRAAHPDAQPDRHQHAHRDRGGDRDP